MLFEAKNCTTSTLQNSRSSFLQQGEIDENKEEFKEKQN